MALRDRLQRLEREARGGMIAIRQADGTVKKFPQSALREAFLEDVGRTLGRIGSEVPTHPLLVAARNTNDPTWTRSFVGGGEGRPGPVEDLSEGP